MNFQEERYVNIISNFRTNELQTLLGAFGRNKAGRKTELKDRAVDLLRVRPVGFNIQAYVSKINEIHNAMQGAETANNNAVNDMYRLAQNQRILTMQAQQQRFYQHPPQYPQQQMPIAPRSALPQAMPQMQRGMYGNSNINVNNVQYNYQPSVPRNIMPNNQQPGCLVRAADQVGYDMPIVNNSLIVPQSMANIKFKNLPFYEVISEICKPNILTGTDRCSLTNVVRGMKESQHKIPLSINHINEIALNRDLSNGKNEYVYQAQIRICLLEPGLTVLGDFLPLGLSIRILSRLCQLPPAAPNSRPGTEARRTARPIHCSHLLKLNPTFSNSVTFNWIPDGKTYVWGLYLVKKLSSDFLLEKLLTKKARSAEETKSSIIKKLADVDPDLATTSYRFSLMCPVGKMRMKTPAKSIKCDHLQCFDASIFILMNEKKPTWQCPTCNSACNYDDIQIQSYFLDIVSSPSLSDSCKEIEILADGTWRAYVEQENNTVMDSAVDKGNPIDSVTLDDSDEGENDAILKVPSVAPPKKDDKPESSKETPEILKSSFVDLTLSDSEDDPMPKEKDKQENEAQAVNATQPATTTVELKPQAQVQPQQAVTSSEQGVIEIDSPSPPPGSPPTETS